MICKANNLEEGTLEIMLPAGSDKIFENVRRVSVKTCDSNLAKFFPEKAFGAEAWIRVEDEYNTIDREKAIANIKAAYCCGCENYNGVRCRACQIMDAMDVLEDEPAVVPDVQRWRKTAEEPPTAKDSAHGNVLVKYMDATFAQSATWDTVASAPDLFTLWMPMPKLPGD